MRNQSKGKPSTGAKRLSDLPKGRGDSPSDGSHQMTLNRPFGLNEGVVESESLSIEYHLTVQITNQSLGPRELSLLLEILNYQAVYFGVNLNMLLALWELYFRLLGKKSRAIYVKDKFIRKTVLVTEIILSEMKKADLSLSTELGFQLDGEIQKLLKPYLISKRTYGSRFRTWRPENLLRVRAVPVDIQFLKRSDNTQPYSSYCKGYGESHPSAHRQKLKPSPEYDGSDETETQVEELFLFNRCFDPVHLLSESLMIKYQNLKQEK